MKPARKFVLVMATGLFLAWLTFNFRRLLTEQDGLPRFILGLLFSGLILFRPKPENQQTKPVAQYSYLSPVLGIIGTLLAITGIIFRVHQFTWLGLLLLLYACLRWTLPSSYSRDIFRSLFLLYWIHPVPARLFGAFQLFMQKLSVAGSEWLLHCLNVRVWANGLILHTGFQTFAVPESCSGMATAVTVLLCGLGTGILFRFTWKQITALELAGLVQVLIFNIIRISMMITLAPKMSEKWATMFLHDTLGVFLLITIFTINIEASLFRKWRNNRLTPPESKPQMHNVFWRNVFRWTVRSAALLLILAVITAGIVRSRPYHRTMMVVGVIDGLMRTNLELADKASADTLKILPDDMDLRTERVQILLRRGKYEEALEELRHVPRSGRYEWCGILEARSLMGLGKLDKAETIVNSLPVSIASSPATALLKAELAAQRDDIEAVIKNIVHPANYRTFVGRTRALFPYLASHEQWKTITKCNSPVPHLELGPLLIAIKAHLTMNEVIPAGELLRQGLKVWPGNPELLSFLSALATRQPGSEWETFFANEFTTHFNTMTIDELTDAIKNCFALYRPDLAWLGYLRLSQLDPNDPSVHLIPAQYANVWFTFRKHYIGLAADEADKTIDLKSYYTHMKLGSTDNIPLFGEMNIPLFGEMTCDDLDSVRDKYAGLCLKELRKREANGSLSKRMIMMYPTVLSMAGLVNDAHAKLTELEILHPENKKDMMIERARLYEQENRWQELYEITCEYSQLTSYEPISICLMRISALMHLNLANQALTTAHDAFERFPGNWPITRALAIIWSVLGDHEQALFILRDDKEFMDSPLMAKLLFDTERFEQAAKIRRLCGLPDETPKHQRYALPYAEWSQENYWATQASPPRTVNKTIKELDEQAGQALSPFMSSLYRLTAEWYRQNGKSGTADPAKWAGIGRNSAEKASALYELTMLLANNKQYERALEAARAGLAATPASPLLWRALIALTNGETKTIADALKACPEDPEIILADIVARIRKMKTESSAVRDKMLVSQMTRIIDQNQFSPGNLVRAGDFLRRNGLMRSSILCARAAMNEGKDFLPAYILGLRCALDSQDNDWAISCAIGAANNAIDPWPFNKLIAGMKITLNKTDNDAMATLEKLMTQFPDEEIWAENLGAIYIQRKHPERALSVLSKLIADQAGQVGIRPAVLAAEASRQAGNLRQAVGILESAYVRNPESRVVLNNLIYVLALSSTTIQRANELLPRLLELWSDSFVVMDTAALVYRNSGKIQKAREYLEKVLAFIETTDQRWFTQNPGAFDLDAYLGKNDELLNTDMPDMERVKLSAARDTLIPLAREIHDRITEKVSIN